MTNIMPNNQVLLAKLNQMYDREEFLEKELAKLYTEYMQLKDDIQMFETMITYVNNKAMRGI
jgi:hypothetical protein